MYLAKCMHYGYISISHYIHMRTVGHMLGEGRKREEEEEE